MMHFLKAGNRPAIIAGLSLITLLVSARLLTAQSLPYMAPIGPPPIAPILSATEYLAKQLIQGMTLERYLQTLGAQFRQADADMNGEISESDATLSVEYGGAGYRALLAFQIMRADLNSDGAVTEDELRRILRYEKRIGMPPRAPGPSGQDPIEVEVRKLMAADADHDGRITLVEAENYAATRPEYTRGVELLAVNVHQLLRLAPEGRTVATLADVEAAAEALFRIVDTDGNGTVSADELKTFRAQSGQPDAQLRAAVPPAMPQRDQARHEAEDLRAKKEAEARAACAMPKASDAANVVVIGTYEAEAVSSATIGSQNVAVGLGNITVEPGTEPIYLVVVSFRPTIWRFSGAVERIERLVLTTTMAAPTKNLPWDKPLVGATGVAAERITFLSQTKCIENFTEVPSRQASIAAAAVQRDAGKDIAVVAARYSLSDVAVPSGHIESLRGENRQRLVVITQSAGTLNIRGDPKNFILQAGPSNAETDLKLFHPGGVIEIDARSVVASYPAERYEVLPQQAGLVQLVQSGKIEQNASGDYLIKEKIRFPAELTGEVKFLLLRGVALPDGNPGQSEVISEETGQRIKFDGSPR